MAGIRASLKSNLKPLDGYEALLKNAKRAQRDIVKLTVQRNISAYLRPMEQIDPGPSQHQGRWSTNPEANARARRWYFWAVRSGKLKADANGRYIRTGGFGRAWRLEQRQDRLSLENRSRGAPYVGSFAKTPRARGGRPNPGHIATKWPQAIRRSGLEVLDHIKDDVEVATAKSVLASMAAGTYKVVIP